MLAAHPTAIALLALLAIGLPRAGFATPTAIESAIEMLALAAVCDTTSLDCGPTATDTGTDSQTTTVAPLSVSVSATGVGPVGVGSTTASGTGDATWSSASAGSVEFETGVVQNHSSDLSSLGTLTGAPGWSYTFMSDVAGVFTLQYDILSQLLLNGTPIATSGGLFLFTFDGVSVDIQGTGSLMRAVAGGATHTVSITPDLGGLTGVGGFSSTHDGSFDWQIDVVPEPSTALLVGCGLLLLSARRRLR